MAPRVTSDGRRVPRLLGARTRTMAALAVVFEDEARRSRRARAPRRRIPVAVWAGAACLLAAVGGGVAAWSLQTPELDRFEVALSHGGVDALDDALAEPLGDSPRARSGRALARAQQAVWGAASTAEARLALRDGDGPHASDAAALLAATGGELPETEHPWAAGIAAGRTLEGLDAAIEALSQQRRRPVGASRTLAALQFTVGDVSASLATLDRLDTAAARADLAYYEAWVRPQAPVPDRFDVPGRAALLRARAAVSEGDRESAIAALADARGQMLPWDPVASTSALRLSFLAGDVQGLRAWSDDPRFDGAVRALARGYADAAAGEWDAAIDSLGDADAEAPWVAYVLGYAAAEQRRWPDAVRLAAAARRGMPGRVELEVLSAWVATHFLDAGGAHGRLVKLSAQAPWAPRVWTARAQAAEAIGRARPEVLALYERALEAEHRPAGAAASLAVDARGEEALHLWTMAAEFEPSEPAHRIALGRAQVERGRLAEAWRNLESVEHGSAGAWLTLIELAFTREVLDPRIDGWIERAEAAGLEPALVARLRLHARIARGEPAASEARALARRHPQDARTTALAALALAEAGRLPAARRLTLLARRRFPRRDAAVVTLALATGLWSQGEVREAAQLAFKAWAAFPTDAPAHHILAAARDAIDIWLDLGNTGGARSIARDLTARLPHSPDAWLLRANVQQAAELQNAACRSLGRAKTLDPNAKPTTDVCQVDPS